MTAVGTRPARVRGTASVRGSVRDRRAGLARTLARIRVSGLGQGKCAPGEFACTRQNDAPGAGADVG